MNLVRKNLCSRTAIVFLTLTIILVWLSTDGLANSAKPVIEIEQPTPGENRVIRVPTSATVKLLFDLSEAQTFVNANDLMFWFDEDKSQILLEDLLLAGDLSELEFAVGDQTLPATQLIITATPIGVPAPTVPTIGSPDPDDFVTASGTGGSRGIRLPALSGLRHTGRDLLFSGEKERDGHPLYSYLLYAGSESGEREDRARFTSAIKAYVGQARTADALESSGAARSSINIFYAPLKPIFEDTSPTSMRLHFAQRSAEEQIDLLSRLYDYPRADVLTGQLRLRGKGPYIVSVLRPLSAQAVTGDEAFLVQDLSSVPPELVELWVEEFKRQVVQEATDSPEHLRRFALNLRTKISVLAEGFSITREAVADMFGSDEGEGGN